VDQRVELGDVLLELALALGVDVLLHQLHRHADAGERSAQLVRRIGEERFVGGDQLFDALCGAVEAPGEPRYLVIAFHLHPCRQLTGAERLDAGLQTLQSRRHPPHARVGTDADREREQRERYEQAEARMPDVLWRPRDQPPAVGQVNRPGGRAPPMAQPAAAVAARVRRGQRRADGRERRSIGSEPRDLGTKIRREALQRRLLPGPRSRRMRETCTSIERSKASSASPLTRSIKASRVSTRPAFSASARSKVNWWPVRTRSAPSTRTTRASRSISSRPNRSRVERPPAWRRRMIARRRANSSRGSNGLGR